MKTLLCFWFLVVGVIVIGHLLVAAVLGWIVNFVEYKLQQRRERKHPHRPHVGATKQADRALKEIERTVNKQ